MTPATHAAVGALIAVKLRRPGYVLPAAFVSHFLLDFIFHFEGFYPLGYRLGIGHENASILTFVIVGLCLTPVIVGLSRGCREIAVFSLFMLAQTLLVADPTWLPRFTLGALFTALAYWYRRDSPHWLWYPAGWFANLPDTFKRAGEWFGDVHAAIHYDGPRNLGDWLYRLTHDGASVEIPFRFEDPYYITGYGLELAGELTILIAALVWIRRRVTPEPAALSDRSIQ